LDASTEPGGYSSDFNYSLFGSPILGSAVYERKIGFGIQARALIYIGHAD